MGPLPRSRLEAGAQRVEGSDERWRRGPAQDARRRARTCTVISPSSHRFERLCSSRGRLTGAATGAAVRGACARLARRWCTRQ